MGGYWGTSAYVVTEQLRFDCQGASYQGSNASFARSLIRGDGYEALYPPCGPDEWSGCDGYVDDYFDGDPDDGTFDSGDQGFNMLLEELSQYVNSLATGYAVEDQFTWSYSERDGLLNFLWYLERYLRLARLEHPNVYSFISGDSCWREAVLTIWGRAWLYLELTGGHPKLGIDDAKLESLVADPVLLDEIERLRDKQGCP